MPPNSYTVRTDRTEQSWLQCTEESKTRSDIECKLEKTTPSWKNNESSEACSQEALRGSCISGYNLDYMELGRKKAREPGGNHSFNSLIITSRTVQIPVASMR